MSTEQSLPVETVNKTEGALTKPKKKKAIPVADVDFLDVAKTVAKSWLDNPAITLLWKTSSEFSGQVQAYADALGLRIGTASKRPGLTLSLQQLDKQVNEAVIEVKVYIAKKFKKANAPAQYARYGIIMQNEVYAISRDRNQRKAALELMVTAIVADGFADEEYGVAFWKDLLTAYKVALEQAGNTAGEVSEKAANKNVQKRAVRKVLSALLAVLKGNYPDTYREMYRKWGWKKESY